MLSAGTRLLVVDPGSEQSALVGMMHNNTPSPEIIEKGIFPNVLATHVIETLADHYDDMVIELTKAYTLQFKGSNRSFFPQQVLDTARWCGSFAHAFGLPNTHYMDRREVKKILCGNLRVGDPQVNAAVLDRYGGSRKVAVGTKKNPGPLYGFKSHLFAALAVGLAYIEDKSYAAA